MWQFIPLSEYKQNLSVSPEPTQRASRQIWDYYWTRYFTRSQPVENNEVEFVSPELQSAPTRLLNWVVPLPNWAEVCGPQGECTEEVPVVEADALSELAEESATSGEAICRGLSAALASWQASIEQGPGIQMILAAPHSGVDSMVQGWAQRHGYLLVTPPTVAPPDSAFADSGHPWLREVKERLADLPENEERKTRLVIVGLEKCYLRHHNGLQLLRELMDYLTTEAPPSLVVCNSWAWAYLRNALHLDAMVRPPLTLERSSGTRVADWLIDLSSGSHYRAFTFRKNADVLFTIGNDASRDEHAKAYSTFCDKLADMSRGNPGIARAIWRQNISIEAAEEGIHEQIQREAEDDPGYTIWVLPLNEATLPTVPTTFTNDDAFILQTLLIHGGLTRSLLRDLLPLSASRISRRLQVMLNAGLIGPQSLPHSLPQSVSPMVSPSIDAPREPEIIEVSPLGYRSVRTFLSSNGFFVDDL